MNLLYDELSLQQLSVILLSRTVKSCKIGNVPRDKCDAVFPEHFTPRDARPSLLLARPSPFVKEPPEQSHELQYTSKFQFVC